MDLIAVYNDFIKSLTDMSKEQLLALAEQAEKDSSDSYLMDEEAIFIEKIIREAFDAGESWGITYSGWFLPTKEEKENKIREVLTKYCR